MKKLTISWEPSPEDPSRVAYFLDGSPAGEGDRGFDRVLDAVRSQKNIEVILKVRGVTSLGGADLDESLPFGARLEELREALGENKLGYEFF